jgi:hypothetical protein
LRFHSSEPEGTGVILDMFHMFRIGDR